MKPFQLKKPTAGQSPQADAFIKGADDTSGASPASGDRRGELKLTSPVPAAENAFEDLPSTFLVKMTPEQALWLEMAFRRGAYKSKAKMVEAALFPVLKQWAGL